ncbi:MAG: phosphate ABC transporter permease subunit PstC [Phycisphaerales bacterium]|nr:phosphate ABC transporter permease subunit PstC [Phycisphaerales bacterium]
MTSLAAQPARTALAAGRAKSRLARRVIETLVRTILIGCAAVSIVTTFAIIAVLLEETRRFFLLPEVTVSEFFLGTEWSPLLGNPKHFGIWPLVIGTMLVTTVAALFSLPLGLITAIYLSEYAPRRVRTFLKPVLEVLAGIPTVVYGFFALTVITPALQEMYSGVETYNALSAGLAIGIMTLPIVSSLSEDALQSVPRSLREGAYAVGATKFDVSLKIVMPAALSGIVASYLLAIARAIGETMIVALAAGNLAPRLFAAGQDLLRPIDPTKQTQTMTGYMVQIFLGDTSAAGVEYRSSYAVAGVLFVMTFAITIIGNRVLAKYREAYQ